MRTRLAIGGAAAVAGLAAGLALGTPHSGVLAGPTARTWWETSRRSLGVSGGGARVTPSEAEVDREPEEADGRPAQPKAGLQPAQRLAIQGLVAEYVIYLKYLSVRNFREGPVDWRMERFQYASLVPVQDLGKPDAEFRVDEKRIRAALDDITDILVEIGEPAVPLVVEALVNDWLYHDGPGRRVPPLDYRTVAGVPADDYNVLALEQFDDVGYRLGNYNGWVPGNGFVRNPDYRDRTTGILLRIGREALAALGKAATHADPKVAKAFAELLERVKRGELPGAAPGAAPAPVPLPPRDPTQLAEDERRAKAEAHRARLFALWQEAEQRRSEGKVAEALAGYRKILASDPEPNYRTAAEQRIAELERPPEPPGDGR